MDPADLDLATRRASLSEWAWRTFAWYVSRRGARSGAAYRVAPFRVVEVPPRPGEGRPTRLRRALEYFETALGPGEAAARPRLPLPLVLTPLQREEARQDWWKAALEYHGIPASRPLGLVL